MRNENFIFYAYQLVCAFLIVELFLSEDYILA
jgi:hypothetical protein